MESMGYENAPATKMLATRCAVCNRPLVDSVSVETGIGPDCRAKHGYNIDAPAEARAEANKLVYEIAAGSRTDEALAEALACLAALGFIKLAAKIAERTAAILITENALGLEVRTPYKPEAVEAFRRIPGRTWDSVLKANTVPKDFRGMLWTLLRRHFPGELAIGPKGPFVVRP